MKMISGWRKLLRPGPPAGEKPAEPREEKESKKPAATRRRGEPTPKGSAAPKSSEKPKRKRESKPKEPEPDAGKDGKTLTEAKKSELRARLRKARSDLLKDGDPSFPVSDDGEYQPSGSNVEGSDSAQESLEEKQEKKRKDKKDKKNKVSEKKDRSAGLTPGTLLTRLKTPLAIGDLGMEQKELEDLNESTSKSWRAQLALKAVEQAGLGKKKTKSSTEKVSKLLARLLTSKEDRASRKKKKRKRTLKNGVIESYSTSSSNYSEESIEEKSDEELEAPLRKKSKERPGSVLALLTSHVAQQLDQGSMVDLDGENQGVVSGVKVMTYFNLFLKPNHLNHHGELRELHSLAA